MAFQQSTRQPVQRPVREASLGSSDNLRGLNAVQARESTWVLFSPTVASSSVLESVSQQSQSQSQSQSQETAGRSRLSDLGSLSADDDAELDSLDSHLADFRHQSQNTQNTQHSNVNLPTHDGLGSFRLGLGTAAQEHLYAFEQFNPRRITKRRRSSLERDLGELQGPEAEFIEDLERTRRIEAWRWEHSRVLLEEIQKETRRRRNSEISRRSFKGPKKEAKQESTEAAASAATADAEEDAGDWHEQEDDSFDPQEDDDEGLWSRLTRKFMHEVMGIDDRVLSVLFGEALPEEIEEELSTTPTLANPLYESLAEETSDSWQMRMIERIARELGLFVHTMSAHTHKHPGAFSTFTRVQQMPLPYAGLPVIPESFASLDKTSVKESKFASDITPTGTTASLPRFKPTIQAMPQQEEEEPEEEIPEAATPKAPAPPTFTQDEWEQDLDIKLVFRYLRSRLFSETSHSHTHHTPRPMNIQDAAAKAARVRQHHPLVGGRFAEKPPVPRACSQTTRRSARRNSLTMSMSMSSRHSSRVSSRHSSRHYWDIGGSGSMIASAGPMGSWGEV